MASEYVQTMTSFSGSDLVVTVGPKVIGELQQITWAIQREKAAIYTFGSADPRSFSRGKRGIAGGMVFAVFNRDALYMAVRDIWHQIAPKAMFSAAGNITKQNSEDFKNAMELAAWNQAGTNTLTAGTGMRDRNTQGNIEKVDFRTDKGADQRWDPATETWIDSTANVAVPPGFAVMRGENIIYADQIPPFDVTMTFANEYGQAAFQKIYDMDILNEGSGVSVDTIVMERQMTYIARRISPIMTGVYSREEGGMIKAKKVVQS